jgi:hypothetical protein
MACVGPNELELVRDCELVRELEREEEVEDKGGLETGKEKER